MSPLPSTVTIGGDLVIHRLGFGAMRLTGPERDDPIHETTLHPGHVHKLPGGIDYFLEPGPEKIQVTTVGVPGLGKRTRTELIEQP